MLHHIGYVRSKMAKFKKNQAEKQGLETPLNCDIMSHAKKETYNISGVKRDFGFFFFCIRNATPHSLCMPNITILEKFDLRMSAGSNYFSGAFLMHNIYLYSLWDPQMSYLQ